MSPSSTSSRLRGSSLLTLCLSGCLFGPSYPAGLPCSERQTCPPGQSCNIDGICSSEPIRFDASGGGTTADASPPGEGDAGPDAGLDAGRAGQDAGSCDEATFYPDRDEDRFGDPEQPVLACAAPPGHVANDGDCDDGDGARYPGAPELCNELDDDCDGLVDDGACQGEVGCADGEREGFLDTERETGIAGCAGGFMVAGLLAGISPTCGRSAGDDGFNPSGSDCRAADLCAAGWHVCSSAVEVAASARDGTCAAAAPSKSSLFFATLQSGPGSGECGGGANDLFGCGTLGLGPAASCAPLDRFSNNLCSSLGEPWSCGEDPNGEAANAVKAGPELGGVLCCRDSADPPPTLGDVAALVPTR